MTTTVKTANSSVHSYFAQVLDSTILSICAVEPTETDEDAAARRWFARDIDYVHGAVLVSLDLAPNQVACVGDLVDVDDDGVATLRDSYETGAHVWDAADVQKVADGKYTVVLPGITFQMDLEDWMSEGDAGDAIPAAAKSWIVEHTRGSRAVESFFRAAVAWIRE